MTIATAVGAGFFPWAPGTFASAITALAFLALADLGLPLYLLLVFVVSVVGTWASGLAEKAFSRSDDGRIVIDEVAGQLVTLTPLLALRDLNVRVFGGLDVFFSLVVTGFVAFRVLDIWKPGVIRWAEQRFSGGVGVMADDLLAGAIGAVLLAIPTALVLFAPGGTG